MKHRRKNVPPVGDKKSGFGSGKGKPAAVASKRSDDKALKREGKTKRGDV